MAYAWLFPAVVYCDLQPYTELLIRGCRHLPAGCQGTGARARRLINVRRAIVSSGTVVRIAKLFSEPNENVFRAADVAKAIHV